MDRIGTRRGLSLTVVFYSVVSVLTSLPGDFIALLRSAFCWARANRPIGQPLPRRFGMVPSRERGLATDYLTADLRLAVRLPRGSSSQLLPLGMASGICDSRNAWVYMGTRMGWLYHRPKATPDSEAKGR